MMIESIVGIAIILVSAGLLAFFAIPRGSAKRRPLRFIPGFQNLRRAIGLAVEDGKRLHVSLGKAGILNPNSASGLVALSTLERIARLSIVSDRPPLATSGEGSLALLSQDTLLAAYRYGNAFDQYHPDQGRLTGPTPLSYIAGTFPIMRKEHVSAHILIGNFGPEVALLIEAAEDEGAFTLAASDSLPAQSVLYALAQEPLIGEELYAVPAYLQAGPFHLASLRTQDVLRWVLIAGLIGGAVFELVQPFIR